MPQFKVKNHRIDGIPYEPARYQGSTITPIAHIVHDTASWLKKFSAKDYLRDPGSASAKPSVHLVAEIDGTLTQLVPLNKRANHAGSSSLDGRSGCNGFTTGIEIVNRGLMRRHSATHAITWFGEKVDIEEAGIVEMTTPQHGHGFWEPYPAPQFQAVVDSTIAIFVAYKSIRNIYPHWHISPRRKVDTNPLFPLAKLRSLVLGRDDPDLERAEEESDEVTDDAWATTRTPGDVLNMRAWPSFQSEIILGIPDGSQVPVLRTGKFAYGARKYDWHKVLYGGREGWIAARYTS